MKKVECILGLILFTMAWCKQDIRRLKREPIINGSVKNISKVPYFASIVEYDPELQQWYPICGASIISNKWILSAAHCIKSVNGLKIRTGSDDYFSPRYSDYLHDIRTFVPHPNYVYGDTVIYNDTVLIMLKKSIECIENLQMPISLPSEALNIKTGLKLNILGFGLQTTKYTGKKTSFPENLLSGTVKVMKKKDCEKSYANYNIENHFCATSKKNEVARGDSGGPAVAKSKLIGIISSGGMKMDHYPGLYIDVRKFVDWIRNVVGAEHFNEMRQKNNDGSCPVS